MARPKIKIPLDNQDRLLDIIGWLFLFILIILPILYGSSLPEKIPAHFGFDGTPDAYSGKKAIWTIPIIGVFMFIFMTIIGKMPDKFNYMVKITEDNAKDQYTFATKMIRFLNTFITAIFCYLTWSSIQIAFGNQKGLSTGIMLLFMTVIFATTGYSLFRNSKSSQSK